MRSWYAAFANNQCNPVQARYWQPKPAEELYRISNDPFEVNNLIDDGALASRRDDLRRRLRAELIATRDTGFIPEAMFDRLAGDKTIHAYAQSPAYPIERIVDLADQATSRNPGYLPQLEKALADEHPVIRYWGTVGALVLQEKSRPLRAKLLQLAANDWPDIRVTAAEALGYHGETAAARTAIAAVLQSSHLYDALAALNSLEYLWRAGHLPLAEVQALVRDLEFPEPADRIPRYLLSVRAPDAR